MNTSFDISKNGVNGFGRLFFLDFLKAISIAAVVSYHSTFLPRSSYESSALLLDIIFTPLRFCVPIILTISFILLEREFITKPEENIWKLIKKRLTRLLIPATFWFSLAAILKIGTGNSLTKISIDILTGEIFTGSYYFLVIFQLLVLFGILRKQLNKPAKLAVFCLLQIIVYITLYSALRGNLSSDIISILRIINRPLIIYWFIYIAFGVLIYKNIYVLDKISNKIPFIAKLAIIIATSLLMIAEYSYLGKLTEGKIPPFDYLIYSCMLSVPGMFICFINIEENKISSLVRNIVYLLSKYSLGIFCLNGIFSQIFLSFGSKIFREFQFNLIEVLVFRLVGWIFLLSVCLGVSVVIDKLGFKKLVC
ncbi:acyltransferase family protein [Anabaena sphaerica FACHB-251]|uniref:Acyltransferase family protein n=1 Tax=Anabaena sphaerica FACHB-251 TaxID=2692883 RepID=A0A926WEM3_9NOST|nr:acyltransferase family protein [Anabaena sphaerica]MBD2293058.1 acyltransferase family protein [Anabaena sphaerica FACHB-251]